MRYPMADGGRKIRMDLRAEFEECKRESQPPRLGFVGHPCSDPVGPPMDPWDLLADRVEDEITRRVTVAVERYADVKARVAAETERCADIARTVKAFEQRHDDRFSPSVACQTIADLIDRRDSEATQDYARALRDDRKEAEIDRIRHGG